MSDFDGSIKVVYHSNDNGNYDSDCKLLNKSPENNTLIKYIIPGVCKDIYGRIS